MIRRFLTLQLIMLAATSTESAGQAQFVEATAIEMSVQVTSDTPGEQAVADRKSRTRMTVFGDKVRIDVLEGSSPQVLSPSPHAYSLSLGSGVDFYTIDTVKKEYSRIDLAQMKKMMSEAMSVLGQLDLKLSGYKFEVDSLGPGETVLGYSTQRWRSVQAMTLSASMGGDSLAMSTENRSESLYAPDVEALRATALPGQDSVMSLGMFGDLLTGEMSNAMMTAYRKLPKGIPIRTSATSTMMTGMIDFTIVTTSEVSKIEKVRLPASFFELPKDYKQVEVDLSALKRPAQ